MNVPKPEPTKRFLRSVADSGKAIEKELVKRWGQYGRLLSADVGAQFQTGFVDAPLWLTGNTDAALLPYRWKRPHIIEVKSKAHDKVLAMKNNERGPDKKHRLQVMTYIGLAYELHPWQEIKIDPKTWKIDPNGETIRLGRCIDGTIYYVSRDDPSTTHEFTYTYDPEFMAQGRDKLSDWKKAFEEGTLPDRPRYSGNKLVGWSKDHCKFCPLKKNVCKPDWENGITELSKSHAIEFTKGIWPDYDYQATRDKVLSRWTSN